VFLDFICFSSAVSDKIISIVDKWAVFDLKVCTGNPLLSIIFGVFLSRDSEILSRLRRHTVYPIPQNKTNKYRSFIHYALAKYQ